MGNTRKDIEITVIKREEAQPVGDKIEFLHSESLASKDLVTKVEFSEPVAQAIGTYLYSEERQGTNGLMTLFSPPGQSGETLYVDTALDVPEEMMSGHEGEYGYFAREVLADNPHLRGHKLVGFASRIPERAVLADAFTQGYKFWVTLGDTLMTEPEDLERQDLSKITVWGNYPNGRIRPLEATSIPTLD